MLTDPSTCDIFEFKPPKLNEALVRFAQSFFPKLLNLRYGKFTYEIENGLEALKALGTNRVILCPNHSSSMDMDAAFLFACILHEPLYFLCAREVFRGSFINRNLLQLFGCYSIVRGMMDHSSYAKSIEILKKGRHKLLLFPEGEISGSNRVILPLKAGAAHLAMKASNALAHENKQAPVYLVPVALRYTYPDISARFLLESIASIESAVNVKSRENQSLQSRIQAVSEAILSELLIKYECDKLRGSLVERVAALRKFILAQLAAYVGIACSPDLDEIESAHRLYIKLYEARWYEEQLEKTLNFDSHHIRYRLVCELINDYHRAMKFIAIGNSFSGVTNSNQDDLINLLMLIQREVCPERRWRLPVRLLISFGTPIAAEACSPEHHQKNEHLIVGRLQDELQTELSNLINTL